MKIEEFLQEVERRVGHQLSRSETTFVTGCYYEQEDGEDLPSTLISTVVEALLDEERDPVNYYDNVEEEPW